MTHSPHPPQGACGEKRLEPAVTPALWFENVEKYQELLSLIPKAVHPSEGVSSSRPQVLTPHGGVGLGYCVHVLKTKSRCRAVTGGQSECSLLPCSPQRPGSCPGAWLPISPSLVFRPTPGSGQGGVLTQGTPENVNGAVNVF